MGSANVVVAEDDPDLRELIEYTLESAGYAVETFGAGDDCWNRLETGDRPDLILLDVMMPGMNGVDVLRRVRDDDRLADLPVVFLSGRGRDSSIVAGSDADADDYVSKPFSPSELRARAGRVLD